MTMPLSMRLAPLIDHAVLAPLATTADMEDACHKAKVAGLASVCVKPWMVLGAAAILKGSGVVASTVIGFPQGGMHPRIKLAESAQALADGARELDMVANLGWVAGAEWTKVADEIRSIAELCHRSGARLKVILETCLLNDEQKRKLCAVAAAAGADYVKTSTGYATAGYTIDDLKLMRESVPEHVGVKASGGVRNLAQAVALLDLGINRIGTGSTWAILEEAAKG
jgi:deoxyribose-phosphate aldolase